VEINIKLDGISLFLQNKEGKNKGKYMISLAEHPLENPFKKRWRENHCIQRIQLEHV
jgi:hypothetical protein